MTLQKTYWHTKFATWERELTPQIRGRVWKRSDGCLCIHFGIRLTKYIREIRGEFDLSHSTYIQMCVLIRLTDRCMYCEYYELHRWWIVCFNATIWLNQFSLIMTILCQPNYTLSKILIYVYSLCFFYSCAYNSFIRMEFWRRVVHGAVFWSLKKSS